MTHPPGDLSPSDTPSSAARRVRARFGRNLCTPALPHDATCLSDRLVVLMRRVG